MSESTSGLVAKLDLSAATKFVLVRLADMAGKQNRFTATQRAIGDDVGLTERNIRIHLLRLESCGFISRDESTYCVEWSVIRGAIKSSGGKR